MKLSSAIQILPDHLQVLNFFAANANPPLEFLALSLDISVPDQVNYLATLASGLLFGGIVADDDVTVHLPPGMTTENYAHDTVKWTLFDKIIRQCGSEI